MLNRLMPTALNACNLARVMSSGLASRVISMTSLSEKCCAISISSVSSAVTSNSEGVPPPR